MDLLLEVDGSRQRKSPVEETQATSAVMRRGLSNAAVTPRTSLGRAMLVALACVAAVSAGADAQPAAPSPTEAARVLAAARAIVAAVPFAFLGTVDAQGQPQSRLMEPFAPDEIFVVWLGTNPSTRKVAEIERDPRASLSYVDPAGPNYVTLVGRATIVRDDDRRRRHWRDRWDAFFPGGPTGPNYVLLRFEPQRIEIVSTTHAVAHQPAAPAPALLERRTGAWVIVPIPR